MKYFYKAVRLTAIPLAIAGILTLLSGFTTTKYFIIPVLGYSLSYFIHTIIIPLVFIPLFILHSLAGTLIMLGRHPRINKRPVKAFVILLWVGVLALFIFFYAAQGTSGSGSPVNSGINGTSPVTGNTLMLTPAEIAKHSTQQDCWIIISGKVYDVTDHLQAHPAGAGTITPYCGKDATAAYDTKGGRGNPHSSFADSTLGPILLGMVGETISGQAVQQVQNQTAPNLGGRGEREDD